MDDNPAVARRPIGREGLAAAARYALVCLAAYLCGSRFTALFHGESAGMGGLWSVISGIVVLQSTSRDTWKSAGVRVFGTAIGAVVSGGYLVLLPFSPLGMAFSIGVTVLICHALNVPEYGRLAALTVAIIMVISAANPALNPLLNAALRFCESGIGAAMAVLVILLWPRGDGGRN